MTSPARLASGLTTGLVDGVSSSARRRLSNSLREKVAGSEGEARAREIWLTPGKRPFGETDPVWIVHADASMFVGGIRALLLQTLHPLAMAGVAGHSGYKSDPWGRLQRTSAFLAATTFGTVETSDRAIAHVRSIHERVRGKAPDGRPYAASDPHLLAWVHAAEVDSFLASYRRHGPRRLTPAQEDLYVEQAGRASEGLGVVRAPRSVAELAATMDDFRSELVASDEAHDTARFLLLHPPVTGASRPGYAALAAGAVALMPMWAKAMLRLPALPIGERLATGPVAGLAVRAVRWAMTDPGDPRTRTA